MQNGHPSCAPGPGFPRPVCRRADAASRAGRKRRARPRPAEPHRAPAPRQAYPDGARLARWARPMLAQVTERTARSRWDRQPSQERARASLRPTIVAVKSPYVRFERLRSSPRIPVDRRDGHGEVAGAGVEVDPSPGDVRGEPLAVRERDQRRPGRPARSRSARRGCPARTPSLRRTRGRRRASRQQNHTEAPRRPCREAVGELAPVRTAASASEMRPPSAPTICSPVIPRERDGLLLEERRQRVRAAGSPGRTPRRSPGPSRPGSPGPRRRTGPTPATEAAARHRPGSSAAQAIECGPPPEKPIETNVSAPSASSTAATSAAMSATRRPGRGVDPS